MSRRRAAEKRTILPDHKFKDLVLAKFMNRIMLDGKKSTSEKIVYGAFDLVSKKSLIWDLVSNELFHPIKESFTFSTSEIYSANHNLVFLKPDCMEVFDGL